jgi:peptidoglycan/xylan/chitin deacetylase (PgdA/CDA1 family)
MAYHRVAELRDTPAVDSRSVSATPAVFTRQMQHLARHYHVIGMTQLLNDVRNGAPLPKRAVLITFDDAYADFAEIAWPILKRFGLPATMFVPTGYPDHPELAFCGDKMYQAFNSTARTELCGTPFGCLPLRSSEEKRRALRIMQNYVPTVPDDEAMRVVDSVCSELTGGFVYCGSVLSWDQLRQLAKEGLTLGSHTRTHPVMTQVTPEKMPEEIRASQEDLRREIGTVLPIFCYPNGNHDDTVVEILRNEGIQLAFTTLSGENKSYSLDLLRLRRVVITPRTSIAVFCARLLRLGAYFDAWRHGSLKKSPIRASSQRPAGTSSMLDSTIKHAKSSECAVGELLTTDWEER